jgi:hypothetical protein
MTLLFVSRGYKPSVVKFITRFGTVSVQGSGTATEKSINLLFLHLNCGYNIFTFTLLSYAL